MVLGVGFKGVEGLGQRGKGEREQSIEHDAVICQPSESKEYVRTTKLLF